MQVRILQQLAQISLFQWNSLVNYQGMFVNGIQIFAFYGSKRFSRSQNIHLSKSLPMPLYYVLVCDLYKKIPFFLERYIENFRKGGIMGVDLLNGDIDVLSELGITWIIHRNRAAASLEQLRRLQQDYDSEVTAKRLQEEEDRVYIDLEKKYAQLMEKEGEYTTPELMDSWEDIDVLCFLKRKVNVEKFSAFLKPIVLAQTKGSDLLYLCDPSTCTDTASVARMNNLRQVQFGIICL